MHELPPEVRQFLYEYAETLEKIEIVALLAKRPAATWTIEEAESRLGIPYYSLASALKELRRQGVCDIAGGTDDAYELTRRNPLLRARAQRLAELYGENRFAIMRLISEAAMQRVRGSMTRAFADAFVLGGRRNGDG